MKISERLETRRRNWQELESLCDSMALRTRRGLGPQVITRFSTLYRAACADLALADAYELPPNTVQYLHRLVGRAHNQLYRSRKLQWHTWVVILLDQVPQVIFNDRCVQLAFLLFWGIFALSAGLAYSEQVWPGFAEEVVGREMLDMLDLMYAEKRDIGLTTNVRAGGGYIQHNTGIGLQCFAFGLLLIPGIMVTSYNAAVLGACFGYMGRDGSGETGKNFFEFVTAHGPFELTAIVLSAGAGLRLGLAWIHTRGLTRGDSLRRTARDAMPIMGAAIILFFGAAMIEGFISPNNYIPYWAKVGVAVMSSLILMVYFVLLGMPRRPLDAT